MRKEIKWDTALRPITSPSARGVVNSPCFPIYVRLLYKKVDPQSSKEEILKVIQHIYESSPAELEPLMKDPNDPTKPNANTPMWVLNVIAAINTDMRYGRTSTIEMLFDRVFGKATQPIEADVNAQVTNTVDLSVLTTEELLQYNALWRK